MLRILPKVLSMIIHSSLLYCEAGSYDWFKNMKKKKSFHKHFFQINTHSASGFQSIDAASITKATQISMPHVKWSFRVSSFPDGRSSWLPGQITNRLTTTPGDAGCIIKHGTIIAALHLMVYNQVDLCLIDLQSSHPPGPSRGEEAKANHPKAGGEIGSCK